MIFRDSEGQRLLAFVVVLCSCVVGLWSGVAASPNRSGWTPLFDGRTLDGWNNPYDWGKAWVEDDQILLQADKKFFLVTDKRYRDFVLEAEVKVPESHSNSGFMFRCHREHNRVYGYQAEVDPSDRQWSGGLYDEGRRGWLHPRNEDGDSAKAFVQNTRGAFQRDDWNRYRIHCVGPSIRIYVNGVLTTDYIDTADRDGHIAIQHHGEAGMIYRFRNLRIRELAAPPALTAMPNDLPLVFFEDFESGTDRWTQTDPNAWKLIDQDGNHAYSQYQVSQYEPPVRSPLNIARIKDLKVSDFVVQVRMEQTGREYGHRDMCVFFGYQDPSHFYYAHLATAADDAAHSIHIVNGAPRAPIVLERTKGVDWGTGYHDVRVARDVSTGSIEVFFDDMSKPVMRAVDKTFGAGGIGFGTFDDTGNIDDVILWGRRL
ncbi:MAG TPA: DUF1080 domain-containing protein [Sedimentisphaerales bacterium]|nr:DUF1080 domain-containing protein [Sedimentisphaerales bacterium]HRS11062.1 DUF1080 domain-containing protein [Sedimentisphaerales bacterium]HRV47730.1 DUF1080 domain-containing protein [Sedimentisphaerales bacterium]